MEAQVLKGSAALITGGTRGIGKAIARRFVEEGASVAVWGTNLEKGAAVCAELQALCRGEQKVVFLPVDVRHKAAVEEGLEQVNDALGPVDILVNNAGITRDGLLMRLSDAQWQEVIDTNLTAIFYTTRAAVRGMIKARRGSIINITSVVGIIGNAGQTNYAASKAGVIGFTKSLAQEVGGRNICVNCIAPGFIKTDMTDVLQEKHKEALLGRIPLGRLGEADDIAHAAVFLASPGARYITGQVLTVDGGMT